MSSDTRPPIKTITVPPFESKLPPEFLEGLDDRGKYLYTEIDKMGQAQKWIIERTIDSHATQQEIRTQVYETNGRLRKAEGEIKSIQGDIAAVRFAKAVITNKWFWIGSAAFLVFVVPWVVTHAQVARDIFKLLLT